MNRFLKLISAAGAFGLLCLGQHAYADWEGAERKWFEQFQRRGVLFADSSVSTVWGGIQAAQSYLEAPSTATLKFSDPEFEKGPLPVAVAQARDLKGVRKAPLLVILPGVFGDIDATLTRRAFSRFQALGFHLAVIPNPWSTPYLRAGPRHNPGNLRIEGEVVLRAINGVIRTIGQDRVTRVEWTGESYGSFLSIVALSLYVQGAETQLIQPSRLSLFGTPVGLDRARDRLDVLMDAQVESYFGKCSSKWAQAAMGPDFYFASRQDDLMDLSVSCAGALFAFEAFHDNLVGTAHELDRLRGTGKIPSPTADPAGYQKWRRAFRFRDFFNEFTPELGVQRDRGEERLGYWLGGVPESGLRLIRILTAVDDPLNLESEWDELPQSLRERGLLKACWGGHLGFLASDDFGELVRLAFRPARR